MASAERVRNVRPDALDFRDLPFRPNVAVTPPPRLLPSIRLPAKDQGKTNACTGFALSRVVEQLLRRAPAATVSPYMLYSMARRYDEFPGSKDEGSSLRSTLKGWFKHGACVDRRWRTGVEMPPVPDGPKKDWWLEAVQPAARRLLPHRCPLDRRHPLRAERGRHRLGGRGVPRRLGGGQRA